MIKLSEVKLEVNALGNFISNLFKPYFLELNLYINLKYILNFSDGDPLNLSRNNSKYILTFLDRDPLKFNRNKFKYIFR